MAISNEAQTRWQLRDDVMFVDARKKDPEDITHSHLIDNIDEEDDSKRNIIPLLDIDAYIVRLISLGVDVEKHLPDIVLAEYKNITEQEVYDALKKVMQMLRRLDYLRPREERPRQDLSDRIVGFRVNVEKFDSDKVCFIGPKIKIWP